ncbi:hypothetical protein [Rhodanobacter denitrificans]|uniref:hypothetical protein n=1 Tax=Rhodanobacter denitrificans TaxID=666685 RepID=UPI001F48E93D|nr:hypothetical protein [Rhodanobacter denitrificans]UJJ60402.1 hypothetical protein LRK55_18355 [Rhodanobacter denitrificans]
MRKEITLGLALILVGCGKTPNHQGQTMEAPATGATAATAKVVPDIKGLKLGDSQAAISAKYPDAQCHPEKTGVLCQVNGQGYGGSESGILQIALEDDHAVMIGASALQGDKLNLIVSAMTTKFGAPDDDAHRPSGASASEVTWTGDHWLLVASPHDAGSSFAAVSLVDADWMRAKLKASVSNAAKDL